MLDILKFCFADIWHFVGSTIWLLIIAVGLSQLPITPLVQILRRD